MPSFPLSEGNSTPGCTSSNSAARPATYDGAHVQIDKANVGALRMAWETSLADDGEQEAVPQCIHRDAGLSRNRARRDCVPPTGNSRPFPTTEIPALQQVTLGGTTCAPKTLVFR
jgi:hypothetical protein